MSGYDYGNARLHAMKSRLLPRREVESLADLDSLDGLLAALTKTPYRKHIEAALARASGMECLTEALRQNMVETFAKVRKFYSNEVADLLDIYLRRYDIDNLKAVLRGLSKNLPADEITLALVPVGSLTQGILNELARAPGPRAAIDTLASMRLPIAQPLLKLRAHSPGAEITDMELALERWHIEEAEALAESKTEGAELLSAALDHEVDLINLANVLRFVHVRSGGSLLRGGLDRESPKPPLLGPGQISFEKLYRAADQLSLSLCVSALADTPYAESLRRGLASFEQSAMLSDFEKALRLSRLEWLAKQFLRDPLGIGVVLGYLAMKTNEVTNLRRIALGIRTPLPSEEIKASLEFIR